MSASHDRAFNKVKNQIGCCGIWCGSCAAGNGVLGELARRYRDMTEAYGLKEWAPDDFDFDEFSKGLSSIGKMPLCPGCLQGGGRPECGIRKCTGDAGIDDCSECPRPGRCGCTDELAKMRSGAAAAGIFVKSEQADGNELIEAWSLELRRRWPEFILFIQNKNET